MLWHKFLLILGLFPFNSQDECNLFRFLYVFIGGERVEGVWEALVDSRFTVQLQKFSPRKSFSTFNILSNFPYFLLLSLGCSFCILIVADTLRSSSKTTRIWIWSKFCIFLFSRFGVAAEHFICWKLCCALIWWGKLMAWKLFCVWGNSGRLREIMG